VRDQTRLLCEFGANGRSAVPEVFHTQRKTQTDGAKSITFRSSLRAVTRSNTRNKPTTQNSIHCRTVLAEAFNSRRIRGGEHGWCVTTKASDTLAYD